MKVKIKRIDESLPLPEHQTGGSVAFDFYSRIDASIKPHQFRILPSNLIIAVPEGYFLLIAARSSTHKRGLLPANGIGVIDQDYHGEKDEIGILVYNVTDKRVDIKRGERIAQGLIIPVERAEWVEGEKLREDSRGGFGSTG
ncbi:MAG: dUTP diphosphatase [Candidatus Doudnabacteria bacterium]|nr:dUTP diphosphatase [Candidatus Doudnabacteria bacterium]